MPAIGFADVSDDFVSDTLEIICPLAEEVSLCAVPGRVVLDVLDGDAIASAHMTVAQAEQHIEHVRQMIAEAQRLAGKYPDAVTL